MSRDEYEKRLVPASDDEVIALAETMWADRALRAIFERVGYDGDLSKQEEEAIDAAIDSYRRGPLWDRDRLHLALAPCLLRQRAVGMIGNLDGAEARAFVVDRKVTRVGRGIKPAKTTAAEVMAFANAMRSDAQCWKAILRLKNNPNQFVEEGDPKGILASFQTRYRYKYGLLNRARFGGAVGLLRGLASGSIPSIDSPEAWASIRTNPSIVE